MLFQKDKFTVKLRTEMNDVIINKLGIPQSSRDSFELLYKGKLLSSAVANSLNKMVGLRNIAVLDYQEVNLDIVKYIIENNLQDFELFIKEIKQNSLVIDKNSSV